MTLSGLDLGLFVPVHPVHRMCFQMTGDIAAVLPNHFVNVRHHKEKNNYQSNGLECVDQGAGDEEKLGVHGHAFIKDRGSVGMTEIILVVSWSVIGLWCAGGVLWLVTVVDEIERR